MCRHLKIDHMKLSRRLICNDDIKHDADPHHKFQCIALVLPLVDALHISHNLCAFLKCSINFINFFFALCNHSILFPCSHVEGWGWFVSIAIAIKEFRVYGKYFFQLAIFVFASSQNPTRWLSMIFFCIKRRQTIEAGFATFFYLFDSRFRKYLLRGKKINIFKKKKSK